MAAPKRTREQVRTDRETIWQLKLGGLNNWQIARQLGTSREMIRYDVAAVEKQKRAHIEQAVTLHRARELDRLTLIIRDAEKGWQRSITERRRSRTRTGSEGRPDQKRRERHEAVVEVEARAGDARFLAVMLSAIEQRIELLGLVNRERGPDIPDEPVREIVIRYTGDARWREREQEVNA